MRPHLVSVIALLAASATAVAWTSLDEASAPAALNEKDAAADVVIQDGSPQDGSPQDGSSDTGIEAGSSLKVVLDGKEHPSRIKYYDTYGGGSCALPPLSGVDYVAVPRWLYQKMDTCGACMELKGPTGTIVSMVTDLCFGCAQNTLDISRQAFGKIARGEFGDAPATWKFVPCPITAPMRFHFKEAITWWAAFQVRRHRFPLAKVELWRTDHWEALERSGDNYWGVPRGFGGTKALLRLTSLGGEQVEQSLTGWHKGGTLEGTVQFDR